jgi:hypothetical protein
MWSTTQNVPNSVSSAWAIFGSVSGMLPTAFACELIRLMRLPVRL